MASSFDIGTDDFMKGNLQFNPKRNGGGVVNSGELSKEKGLSLYLLLMFVMKASFLPERDPLCLLQEKWSSCRQTHPIN